MEKSNHCVTLDEHLHLQERMKAAASLKSKGNTAYGTKHQYQKAVQYYTKAIEVTPTAEPTFFSNRAACAYTNTCCQHLTVFICLHSDDETGYMNMQPPQYQKVVEDCDAALALDKHYVKALNRRANALEALERYEEASRGAYSHSMLAGIPFLFLCSALS